MREGKRAEKGEGHWDELDAAMGTSPTAFKLCLGPDKGGSRYMDSRLFALTTLRELQITAAGLESLGCGLCDMTDNMPHATNGPNGPHGMVTVLHGDPKTGVIDHALSNAGSSATGVGGEVDEGTCLDGVGDEPVLRDLVALEHLTLSNNKLGPLLKPPGAVYGLTALHSLDVSSNNLQVMPQELVSCTALRILDLSKNDLTSMPRGLGTLPSLTILKMAGNRIALGGIPEDLYGAPRLAELNLRDNMLAQVLPEQFSRLLHLVELDVTGNHLSAIDAALAQPGGSPRLRRLGLGGNPWEDKKLLKLANKVNIRRCGGEGEGSCGGLRGGA